MTHKTIALVSYVIILYNVKMFQINAKYDIKIQMILCCIYYYIR